MSQSRLLVRSGLHGAQHLQLRLGPSRALLGVQARLLGRGQPLLERPLDPGQALQERLLNLTQALL